MLAYIILTGYSASSLINSVNHNFIYRSTISTNPYFSREGYAPEQNLYEDLVIESLKIFGHDFLYVPRNIVQTDQLFGEDIASKFDQSYPIEMYVETVGGYDGEELFQKFGLEIKDESVFIVSKRRWNEVVGEAEGSKRPKEGDLIYVPFSKALFEISFVEHEDPFYQLKNLNVYKLSVTLFEYNDENLDLSEENIDVSNIVAANSMDLTINAAGSFKIGETISQTQDSGNVTGTLAKTDGTLIQVSNVTSPDGQLTLFEKDLPIVSSDTQLSRMVLDVSDTTDRFEKNDAIEEEAENIVEFDADNPFGGY